MQSARRAGVATLLGPKSKGRKEKVDRTLSYRPSAEQLEFIKGIIASGYTMADALREIVGTYQLLDTQLASLRAQLAEFAEHEGIKRADTPEEDTSWVKKAIARAAVVGIKAKTSKK